VPKADEVISYQIPAYKLDGSTVLYFAGWKAHYSLYPIGKSVIAAFKQELAPYEVNAKGTARFPFSQAVPVTLIQRIAKFRAKEVADLMSAKPAAAKKKKKTAPKRKAASSR
jgi:uncharacterized protein YdhG (YjbR/CyaY superfamily)